MTNYAAGHLAEEKAAQFLAQHGYRIVALNWRTKYCEIDIVAQKGKRVYFVEVKSRASHSQGEGFDYITQKKLAQMKFAAEFWVAENQWRYEYQLAAVGINAGDITFTDEIFV